jgi:hypothetical protein
LGQSDENRAALPLIPIEGLLVVNQLKDKKFCAGTHCVQEICRSYPKKPATCLGASEVAAPGLIHPFTCTSGAVESIHPWLDIGEGRADKARNSKINGYTHKDISRSSGSQRRRNCYSLRPATNKQNSQRASADDG